MTRQQDFNIIKAALNKNIKLSTDDILIIEGESLEILKSLPDKCVSLILTDPPYHTTKKKNIYGDTSFLDDQDFLNWMKSYAIEWKRILKPNGSLFCFCSSAMSAKLEVMFSEEFNILSSIVWTKPNEPGFDGWKGKMKKENLRQWYPHSERIIFASPAIEGNLHRSYFAKFLRDIRKESGLTAYKLTELTGSYGKVNHGGAVSNWETGRNIPNRLQYQKICDALLSTGNIKSMPSYENVIRIFNIDGSKEFTDVWNFQSVRPYKCKHPAEKPISMLVHAIEATTFPGDIVLDCFSGSGSTLKAANKLGRKSIGIEIETKWINYSIEKLQNVNTYLNE
jgi:site-specific DNA-methyltransferase (adenine-specific)